jgi:hypothetical protein
MKNFLYLLLSFFAISCSTSKSLNFESSLISIIKSEEFTKNYRLCEKKTDTILIYNNLDSKIEKKFSNIDCGKTIMIENNGFPIDMNKHVKFDDQKIILYKLEIVGKKRIFTFLNNHSNMNLKISINHRNVIKLVERGFF